MPDYGGNGTVTTYDGTGVHGATSEEMLRQILDFLGLSYGPHDGPVDTTWLASRWWNQNMWLPPYAAPPESQHAFGDAIRKYLASLGLDPAAYVQFLNDFGDYLGSIQHILNGSWFPTVPGGGGSSTYGGLQDAVDDLGTNAPQWYESPPTPPTAASIATSVWGTSVSHEDGQRGAVSEPMQNAIGWALTWLAKSQLSAGFTWPWLPDYVVHPYSTTWWYNHTGGLWGRTSAISTYPAPIDDALWRDDDTYLTYLQREQPEWNWNTTDPTGYDNPSGFAWTRYVYNSLYYIYFRTVRRANESRLVTGGSGAGAVDSRYPGPDGVTFGDAIAITETSTVVADCDGCLLEITALPPGQGRQPTGGTTRYPYVGWMSFVDADGNEDLMQRLELDKTVFLPHNIVRAAGISVYAKPGLHVTITPWVLGV